MGSAAQTKAMKKVAGRLRLELAQFRELAAFAQFASELDEGTQKRIERGRVLTEILKQPERAPLPFEKQVVLMYAGTNGYFDDVAPTDVSTHAAKLLDYLEKMHRDITLDKIKSTGDLAHDTEESLKKAIGEWKKL